jgi:hypothetical protein
VIEKNKYISYNLELCYMKVLLQRQNGELVINKPVTSRYSATVLCGHALNQITNL